MTQQDAGPVGPAVGLTPGTRVKEETGAVALLRRRDSVHALSEEQMTALLPDFLLGAPDVGGMRIVDARVSPVDRSVLIEVVDRHGEGRSFAVPVGRWRVGY